MASPGVLVAAMPGGAGRGVAAGDTGLGVAVGDTRLGVAVGDTRLGVAVGDISGTVVDAEPIDDPRAGWCRACKTGSRASGYRNCSDVMR